MRPEPGGMKLNCSLSSFVKVIRLDVPRDWPDLLPALSEAVQSQNDVIQHRLRIDTKRSVYILYILF